MEHRNLSRSAWIDKSKLTYRITGTCASQQSGILEEHGDPGRDIKQAGNKQYLWGDMLTPLFLLWDICEQLLTTAEAAALYCHAQQTELDILFQLSIPVSVPEHA